uniref:Transcriptional coactivator p15 (PC4) C-terminal domain-containing protein n=1 Tax=Anopheles dirus TaxID=7168 RepID=A0A182NPR9_9DIPT
MASSNVKLPDLIDKWIEVQKKRPDLERAKPLDIDAINLTLLLKSMGLRLQYLDFEADKSNTDNLTITVKCNRSGMRADLSYELLRCSCPEKNDQESSFWEVQATGPKVFSKFKNNTSSNLLPDVSESCALVSKAMLSNLLDFYETSIRQVKEEKEQAMLHSPLKSPRPKVSVISPGLTMKTPFSTPPAEGKCFSRVETAAVESDAKPAVQRETTGTAAEQQPEHLVSTQRANEEQAEAKSNTSAESVGINNKTHELVGSDHHHNKPVVDAVLSSAHTSVADDHAFEAMKTLVTSSPNENQPAHDTAGLLHDRDQNVINYLQQARSQIDMALLLMQINTTQDMTHTITPQHASTVSRKSLVMGSNCPTPKFAQPLRSSSLLSIERRRPPVDAGTGTGKKKLSATSALAFTPRLSLGSSVGRADTPRPSMAQVKSVAALRKAPSMPTTGGSSLVAQPATGSLKKPATGSIAALTQSQRKLLPPGTPTGTGRTIPKPPTSGRPMTAGGAGLIRRSSSASYIQKKYMPKTKKPVTSDTSDSGPDDREPVVKKAKPTGASNSSGEHVFELGKMRKVTVSEFKGKTYVNIREFYEKDGKDLPSKKGISLPVDQWKKLLGLADDVNNALKQF